MDGKGDFSLRWKKEFTIDGKGNFLLNDPFDGKEDLLWMEKEIALLKNPSDGKEDLLWMTKGNF